MTKQFESSRGRGFSREEIEDLPPFDMEQADHDAWLEYENEHGISPNEVHAYISNFEEERTQELEPESDVMVDTYGQEYEQFKLDLDGDKAPIPEKKKSRVSERLSSIAGKMKEMKDNTSFKLWQATEATNHIVEATQNVVNTSTEKVTQSVEDMTNKTAITVINTQDEIMEGLMEKHRLVSKNIEAKNHIRDFAAGELEKEELAYLMANDPDLQKSIGSVSHSMLHPSPLKGLKTERTNLQLDIGYGFSVFMEELRQPLDNEVEAIMEIDNMSMLVEMGQDKNIPPTVRENYFLEAGISEERMETLVPRDDYRDYVVQLEQKFRQEHMAQLGLTGDDMLDIADENRLNELVEDSMSLHNDEEDVFIYTSGPEDEMENTYKETYQMSSEEMFQMFDSADNYEANYEDMNFPDYVDYDFENAGFMQHSVEEYHALQDMSIHDTQEYLQSIEAEMQAYDDGLHMMSEPKVQSEVVNAETYEAPMLSDEDLAFLDEQAPPELSDDDLRDLYEENYTQQK